MRDDLPKDGANFEESGIINLDSKEGFGSHWCCWKKSGNQVIYFDSFGNLKPPKDLMEYLGVAKVAYNYETYQNYDSFDCGHLCLKFLAGQLL